MTKDLIRGLKKWGAGIAVFTVLAFSVPLTSWGKDLQLTMTTSSHQVVVGHEVTYNITVKRDTNIDDTSMSRQTQTVVFWLPPELDFLSVGWDRSGTCGQPDAKGYITCTFSGLGVGESVGFDVQAKPNTLGIIQNVAFLKDARGAKDSDSENNVALASLQVLPDMRTPKSNLQ